MRVISGTGLDTIPIIQDLQMSGWGILGEKMVGESLQETLRGHGGTKEVLSCKKIISIHNQQEESETPEYEKLFNGSVKEQVQISKLFTKQ